MKTELATIEAMSLEAIAVACQSTFEEVEGIFRMVEKHRNRLEYFGKLLTAAKAKVPHGEWEDWLTDTFQGRLPMRTAQRWMAGPKAPQVALLESGEVPREARKPGRVKVVNPPADHSVDTNKKVDGSTDDDPTPDPPTIRKTAAGSRKVPESEKPPTRPVQAELLPDEPKVDPVEDWFRAATIDEIVTKLIQRTENQFDQKKTAKALRKWADKLDPPTKFVPPTVEEVEEYCRSRNNGIDAEAFVANGRANGWRLSNGNKMQDWQGAIITWEKNQKRFNQNGKGNNGHSKQSLADSIADKAAYLRDIFGDSGSR